MLLFHKTCFKDNLLLAISARCEHISCTSHFYADEIIAEMKCQVIRDTRKNEAIFKSCHRGGWFTLPSTEEPLFHGLV